MNNNVIKETLKVTNQLGLHLRAAAQLVRVASKYKCTVLVRNNRGNADGKSLINLLALAAAQDTEVTLIVEGEDSRDAMRDIRNLFSQNFGEA